MLYYSYWWHCWWWSFGCKTMPRPGSLDLSDIMEPPMEDEETRKRRWPLPHYWTTASLLYRIMVDIVVCMYLCNCTCYNKTVHTNMFALIVMAIIAKTMTCWLEHVKIAHFCKHKGDHVFLRFLRHVLVVPWLPFFCALVSVPPVQLTRARRTTGYN